MLHTGHLLYFLHKYFTKFNILNLTRHGLPPPFLLVYICWIRNNIILIKSRIKFNVFQRMCILVSVWFKSVTAVQHCALITPKCLFFLKYINDNRCCKLHSEFLTLKIFYFKEFKTIETHFWIVIFIVFSLKNH